MSVAVHKYITGSTAVEISESIEAAIRQGRLAPGTPLPTVRALAARRGVSPATVASAYRRLRERGHIVAAGRRGTRVSSQPGVRTLPTPPVAKHVLNLTVGNPDPEQLPRFGPVLEALDPPVRLYAEEASLKDLLRLARRSSFAQGLPLDSLAVVGGAFDGMERVLSAHLRRGDRVAVEDPAFSGTLDLLSVLGLVPVPVEIDDSGLRPDALRGALEQDVQALIVTPRAQNPTGAALDERRVQELRPVLCAHPQVLLIEDDHAGPVAGSPARTLWSSEREHWAVVASVSKSLGPDLRLAVMAGDESTIARVEGRQLLGIRWVSHLLQRLVVALWSQPNMQQHFKRAARTYTERREALLEALAEQGIQAHGRSGLNVWVPVPEEATVVSALMDAGYAVMPGERYRLESPPAIRITTAALQPADALGLAAALANILAPRRETLAS